MKKIKTKVSVTDKFSRTCEVRVFCEQFDSLTEFNRTLNNAKPNEAFKWNFEHGYAASMDSDYDFTMTKTYEEADQLMRTGYAEGMESMLKAEGGVKLGTSVPQARDVNNYMGYRPNVPRAIIGLPKAMVQRVKVAPKVRTISLFYDCGALCNVDAKELALAGKNFMALVKHYEQRGVRVEVNIIKSSSSSSNISRGRTSVMTVKIKGYDQKVNPLLMSYPMTHPSFFRRHAFRWLETSECGNMKDFARGYGYTTRKRVKDAQKMFRDCGIIPSNGYFLDCESVASATTIDDIIKLIN